MCPRTTIEVPIKISAPPLAPAVPATLPPPTLPGQPPRSTVGEPSGAAAGVVVVAPSPPAPPAVRKLPPGPPPLSGGIGAVHDAAFAPGPTLPDTWRLATSRSP